MSVAANAPAQIIEKEKKFNTWLPKPVMRLMLQVWRLTAQEVTDITQHYFPSLTDSKSYIYLKDDADGRLSFLVRNSANKLIASIKVPEKDVIAFGRDNLAFIRSENGLVHISDDIEGRIRKSFNRKADTEVLEVTFKRKTGNPEERVEFNFTIPLERKNLSQLRRLNFHLEAVQAKFVEKVRYSLGMGVTVDNYLGNNRGLVVIESERQKGSTRPLVKPWFAWRDVTAEKRLSARNLAYKPFKTWAPK